MTERERADLIQLAKKVGIVCGALIALGTCLQWVSTTATAYVARPIMVRMDSLAVRQAEVIRAQTEERIARQRGDSLIVEQIAKLGESTLYPIGSEARERAVQKVTSVPRKLAAQRRTLKP